MQPRDKKRRKYLWIGLAVAAALLLAVMLRPAPTAVQAAKAFRGDLTLDLSTTGVVEGNVADVSPKIVGKVTEILVDEGDQVHQGQVVAMLDTSELKADVEASQASLSAARTQVSKALQTLGAETKQVNSQIARARAAESAARANLADLEAGARPQEILEAEAALRQAEAQSRNAQADLSRAEHLFSRGAISRQQLDSARTAADVAKSEVSAAKQRVSLLKEGARSEQVAAARAEVRSAEAGLAEALAGRKLLEVRQEDVRTAKAQVEQAQAALDAAKARLALATITSPATGSVVRKHVEVGETVGPQQPIVTVSKAGPIWVTAEVDQEDVAAVRQGQEVQISLDAFPGQSASGVVTNVSSVAVPKEVGRVRAKIVRTRIDVSDSSLPLKPGMEVNIDGHVKAATNVVLTPNDSVVRLGDKDYVYIIDGSHVRRRQVVTGLSNFDYTTIQKGLSPGTTVAASNTDKLADGSRVRIEEAEK